MKRIEKLILGLFILFTLSSNGYAGSIGYVWIPQGGAGFYDKVNPGNTKYAYIPKPDIKKGMPEVNSIIRIEAKNRLYFGYELIQSISSEYFSLANEKKCSSRGGGFSRYMLNERKECSVDKVIEKIKYKIDSLPFYEYKNPVKARVLGYVRFSAGMFMLIEEMKILNKDISGEITEVRSDTKKRENKIEPNLCSSDEDVYFSCQTSKQIISFCGSKDLSFDKGYLVYRYGDDRNYLNMEYLSKGSELEKNFKYGINTYPKGFTQELSFSIDDLTYTLHEDSHRYRESGAGIFIEKNNKKHAYLECNNNIINYGNSFSTYDLTKKGLKVNKIRHIGTKGP